jgi:hypothetical protein
MRILLDECVPRRFGNHLAGHTVSTVPKMGWSGIKNGKLLALAVSSFDVFLTVDQNLQHQQAVATLDLAIVIVRAISNDIDQLIPLVPDILKAIAAAKKGAITLVPP